MSKAMKFSLDCLSMFTISSDHNFFKLGKDGLERKVRSGKDETNSYGKDCRTSARGTPRSQQTEQRSAQADHNGPWSVTRSSDACASIEARTDRATESGSFWTDVLARSSSARTDVRSTGTDRCDSSDQGGRPGITDAGGAQ